MGVVVPGDGVGAALMVVLGFDEPMWVTIIRERGPEIAAAVMAEVPGLKDLTVESEPGLVVAAGRSERHDQYTAAWNVTEALTELWNGFADQTVGLQVTIGSLRIGVPPSYFVEGILTRRRWATLATSMLVHASVHETSPIGLFGDQGPHHAR